MLSGWQRSMSLLGFEAPPAPHRLIPMPSRILSACGFTQAWHAS
jgi:hypothetical protein